MRRALAALTALAMGALTVVSLFATNAAAAAVPLSFSLDDRQNGTIVAQREGTVLEVPLLPVAAAMGWTMDRSEGGWRLRGDGRTFLLRPKTAQVTERGVPALVLLHAPREIENRLFVAVDDLAAIFDVRADLRGRRLALSTTTIDAGVTIAEQKKPPAKKAAATPAPSPTPLARGFQGGDRVAVTLVQSGPSRTIGVSLQTVGNVRSGLAITDDGVPTTGSVTIGSIENNVTLGDANDPLIGAVFRDPGLIGASIRTGRSTIVAGRRSRDGRTVTGFATTHGARTDFVEVLRAPGGRFDQAIVGRRVSHATSWGLFTEEMFAGTKGVGIGAYARTKGRLYGELTATLASSTLPLQPGDAPVIADGAYELSHALTARLGFSGGHGTSPSPFGGFVAHGAHFGGAVTVARSYLGVSTSYAGRAANAQVYLSRSAGQTEYSMRAAGAVRDVALEFSANADTQSDRDLSLLVRRAGHGLDLLAGFDAGRLNGASWMQPVVGVAAPLVKGLDLEATVSPQGSARPVVRISLVAGFAPPHRSSRTATVPLIVRIEGGAPAAVVLFVDGFRTKAADGSDLRVDVVPGAHFVRLESADGTLGSPETRVDTATAREATLPLWPLRTVAGRVAIDAPASSVPRDLTLAGVAVILEPGGVVTTADAQGAFAFPPSPIAPGATVRIDEDSAPNGLTPGAAATVGAGSAVTVKLVPARTVERVTFPGSGQ